MMDDPFGAPPQRAEESRARQDVTQPPPAPQGDVGIALSGGGLRAASFSLGALQALDDEYALLRGPSAARYIAAVSGGSYIAGTLALVNAGPYARYCSDPQSNKRGAASEHEPDPLEPADEEGSDAEFRESLKDRRPVLVVDALGDGVPAESADFPRPLSQGSPEVNWILRHSRYLVDDGAWSQGLLILVYVVFSVLPLFTAVALVAVTAASLFVEMSALYTYIFDVQSVGQALDDGESPGLGATLDVIWFIMGLLLIRNALRLFHVARTRHRLAQEAAAGSLAGVPDLPRSTRREAVVGIAILAVGSVFVLVTICGVFAALLQIPTLTSQDQLWGAAGWLLLGALAATLVAGLLWAVGSWHPLAGARTLGRLVLGAVAFLLPWTLITLVFAQAFSWAIGEEVCGAAWIVELFTGRCPRIGEEPLPFIDVLLSIVYTALTLGLLWLALFVLSQFSALLGSLHNVYAGLLARCFAVVRTASGAWAVDVRANDVALSSLGNEARPTSAPRVPELRICAAANVSDRGTTFAGVKALPLVLSPSTIRIPTDKSAVLDTRNIERAHKKSFLSAPLGLASAMAISGAAISPAMGRHTVPQLRALLAVIGMRIGRWVPNPSSPVARQRERDGRLRLPEPDLAHLTMEMLGLHQSTRYSVYGSDGGHFENMGFVELLRERCEVIWLVDASPNISGHPLSLTQSLTLAEAEAGCDIDIEMDQFGERDGDGFALSTIATGSITYSPRSADESPQTGTLNVIRLGITAHHSSIVKNWARLDRGYPFHPTIQQIYPADRVEAYRRLGWESMRLLIAELEARSAAKAQAARPEQPSRARAPDPDVSPHG